MSRTPVLVLGLSLHAACSGARPAESAPPAPAPAALPTWDEVPSAHPPGATNPPRPALIVTPAGTCYKQWVSPMLPATRHGDRVEPCETDCGTEIQCPERAAALLEAYRSQPAGTEPAK